MAWLNPFVTVRQTGPSNAVYSLGTVNNAPMDVIFISYAKARRPSAIRTKMNPHIENDAQDPGLGKLAPSAFFASWSGSARCRIGELSRRGPQPRPHLKRICLCQPGASRRTGPSRDPVVPFTFTQSDGTQTQTVKNEYLAGR